MFAANTASAGVPGQNWIAKSGPNRAYEQGAYGNGIYLYLANNAYLATSTDANTWTESTTMRNATLSNTRSIVYSSALNGFFVGSESSIVYSFDNGSSWTRVSISGSSSVSSMVSGGSTVIGFDSGGRVLTSTNGTTWTNRGTMTTLAGWGSGAFAFGPYGGDHNGSLFMLIGGNSSPTNYAACATSADGVTWTNRPNLDVTFGGSFPGGVTWSPSLGKWFVWSLGNKLAYSSDDGASWTLSPNVTTLLPGLVLEWVTEVNGTLVALAGSGVSGSTIITSNDGVNWQMQTGLSNLGVTTDSYLKNGGILVVAQPNSSKLAVSV